MLVLSRKDGEVIEIGEDIRIVLVRGHNGRATIGIEAPANVKIVREEIAEVKRAS
jgi:carbon storage regulator